MSVTPKQRARDLAELRARWREEGHYRGLTIPEQLEVAAREFADAGFVFTGGDGGDSCMRYPEVLERSRAIAAGLQQRGLRVGDRVAVQVPNRPELVLAYFAVFIAGGVVVPITHIYGPAEMSFILREAGARMLLVPRAWRSIDYLERVARLEAVPELEQIVVMGDGPLPAPCTAWSEVTTDEQPSPVEVDPDDVCVILYTSGTTGDPKGVQHTHHTLLSEMATVPAMLGMKPGEAKLAPWPAGHVAGLIAVLGGLTEGCSQVLMDRWDVQEALRIVPAYRPVATSGTPLHAVALIDAAIESGTDISALRYMQVGGANVAPSLVERAERFGLTMGRAYGSTEHPTSAYNWPDDSYAQRVSTDGQPHGGNEIIIVDDNGTPLPPGQTGEIATRGPAQFIGYRDSTKDVESFLPGGWFLTGDIGRFDENGCLVITDRRKDIIIRGGENIASKEVEDVLARHPAITEVAVVAAPDEKYGEKVAAFVRLAPGATLSLADVVAHFDAAGVAKQKTPEHLHIVDDLPRTQSGKVRKVELRQRLRKG